MRFAFEFKVAITLNWIFMIYFYKIKPKFLSTTDRVMKSTDNLIKYNDFEDFFKVCSFLPLSDTENIETKLCTRSNYPPTKFY